jgi:hypothetical protein
MPIPENIIQRAADCSVKQFIQCSFEGKYKVLLIDGEASDDDLRIAFEYIYAEYADYSGLFQSQEFDIVSYINSLDNRIQFMKRFIDLQRRFIKEFNVPFLPSLNMVKKYGHHVYWDQIYPDKESFLQKLNKIEGRETKYQAIIDKKVGELIALRKKKQTKEHSILESRKDFVTTLNRLSQSGFHIDKDKTSVEELALMVKDRRDEVEESKAQQKIKKVR